MISRFFTISCKSILTVPVQAPCRSTDGKISLLIKYCDNEDLREIVAGWRTDDIDEADGNNIIWANLHVGLSWGVKHTLLVLR